VAHTTSTEYVIVDTDLWNVLDADLDAYVTDVAVGGEYIWLAEGGANGDNGLHRYRFYNSGGTWTSEEENTSNSLISDKILVVNHPNEGELLYSSTTNHDVNGVSIYKGQIPRDKISTDEWLFYPRHEFDTTVPWNDVSASNVTQTIDAAGHTKFNIAAAHTTGIVGTLNLDPPIDIRAGQALVAEVYSDAALSVSGDYRWVYDDVEDLGQTRSPAKVFLAGLDESYAATKVLFHVDYDGTPVFTDLTQLVDGLTGTIDTLSITADDYIHVGYSKPFNQIFMDFGGTVNLVADRTLTAAYFNGEAATTISATDGTKVADNGTFRTFAQNGTISWTIPSDWKPSTINSTEAYWITLSFSGDLTASIIIENLYLKITNANDPPAFMDLTGLYAGAAPPTETLTVTTDDYLYIGHGTGFNKITITMDGTDNAVASVMTGAYFNGSSWASAGITDGTITAGASLAKTGDVTFSLPIDWVANTVNGTEAYWIRLDFSVNLTPNMIINEITVTRSNNIEVQIPVLAAGEWTTVMTDLAIPGTIPDESSIKSIGLKVNSDEGLNVFHVRKLWLADTIVDSVPNTSFRMPGNERINGLQAYAGNVDDPILNPWIFTTGGVYEMQTQNDGQIVKIPLEELGSLASPENGIAHCVNGTYLYFNLGERLERYFNRTLDDIGPDRDMGLPSNRPGLTRSLVSYPGRVYAAIDADSGQSSVLALDGTAWHEVYRAPRAGINYRIRSIYSQAIPGTNVDKLWISMGYDLLSIPICIDPYNETDYTYTHEGSLTTAYIHANLLDVVKLWKSLKIFVENIAVNRYIVVDYQVDADTAWTEIGTFDTTPVEEIDIASTLPQAKRIRYRLRFISNDVTNSPRLKATVTEGVAFVPVKYQYAWTFRLTQDLDNIDNFGTFDDTLTSLQQYDQLVSWANGGQPLTLRHESSLYDNKTVFLNPTSVSPLRVVSEGEEESQEVHVASITCIEA
jgi:hypothetical protein